MPGQIVSISVKAGQDIQSGDLLLTIAAMKMETSIHAERSGVIKWVVDSGSQVEAKDLLAEYEEQ
jgi:pyruvate carboxylase